MYFKKKRLHIFLTDNFKADNFICKRVINKAEVAVIMLDTSNAHKDRTKAIQYEILSHFTNKPLTREN